ncbi:hypothetical protein J6590_106166 [Homalodisca vitripennis]|nr:hypothetical protein J6590_106166 [Homalodisca vitripennis]
MTLYDYRLVVIKALLANKPRLALALSPRKRIISHLNAKQEDRGGGDSDSTTPTERFRPRERVRPTQRSYVL